jgi:hypothetical protein
VLIRPEPIQITGAAFDFFLMTDENGMNWPRFFVLAEDE